MCSLPSETNVIFIKSGENMEIVHLESSSLRIWVDPSYGGAILKGQVYLEDTDEWVDFMPNCLESYKENRKTSADGGYPMLLARSGMPEASFLLAPYSNRIKNGKLEIAGKSYTLARSSENAIHGDSWHRKSKILNQSSNHIVCEIDFSNLQTNWPANFKAKYSYKVEMNKLIFGLNLTNLSKEAFPFEGGFHPYFKKSIETKNGNCFGKVQSTVESSLVTSETGIPDGGREKYEVTEETKSLNHGFSFGKDEPFIDHYFKAAIKNNVLLNVNYEGISKKLAFTKMQNISGIVVYNPVGECFAVEPVSHPNGIFNNKFIKPGESKEISFELSFS